MNSNSKEATQLYGTRIEEVKIDEFSYLGFKMTSDGLDLFVTEIKFRLSKANKAFVMSKRV